MPMSTIHHVILAEDHVFLRECVKALLSDRPEFSVIGEAGDGLELLKLLEDGPAPDVIILDLSMPGLGGLEATREIRKINPDVKVLVLTMYKEEDLLCQAFIEGADGYLVKDNWAAELFPALHAILKSQAYVSPSLAGEVENAWLKVFIARKASPFLGALSPRELEILRLLAKGESNGGIARTLGIEASAVGHDRASIIQKLHLEKTADLAG